ncbi:hypothetical protein OG342_06360 [Streptomyces bobili]|uniref:hypothetical protein n=1 Tax=Streptomyces bobili TaxID=67280 RepID=UPI00224E0752|nr:hypothetical protein [Streptomyces bobili]MCX5522488.1 hypothetical protein [Streptomyces bobili]
MIWQWTGLAVFSLTLLPAGIALLTGHVPQRLHSRLAPMRPRGVALLAFYTAAPLNTLPRLADASTTVTLAATALAGLLTCAGSILLIVAGHRTQATTR